MFNIERFGQLPLRRWDWRKSEIIVPATFESLRGLALQPFRLKLRHLALAPRPSRGPYSSKLGYLSVMADEVFKCPWDFDDRGLEGQCRNLGPAKPTTFQVRLTGKRAGNVTRCFSASKYGGSLARAEEAALEFWRAENWERGLVKRAWRLCTHDDGAQWYEFKLQDPLDAPDARFLLLDPQDLEQAKGHTWCAKADGRNSEDPLLYAVTNNGPTQIKHHRMLCPDWETVDHINRNGLDNRRVNLRDGSGGTNSTNRGLASNNTSGCTGVAPRPDER